MTDLLNIIFDDFGIIMINRALDLVKLSIIFHNDLS